VQVDPERYSVAVQPVDDVQTSPEPVPLLEVAPVVAQAHVASIDAVAAVFEYALPVPQTVTADAHCVTVEVRGVVAVAW
jgi:hypothetical protein